MRILRYGGTPSAFTDVTELSGIRILPFQAASGERRADSAVPFLTVPGGSVLSFSPLVAARRNSCRKGAVAKR